MSEMKKKSEYLVEVNNLKQYFPIKTGFMKTTPLKAVDGVSFNIKAGETLGLVGESGCGKTTVGRSLLRLYTPTSGDVFFDGERVDKNSIGHMRKQMQMVFQDPCLLYTSKQAFKDILDQEFEEMPAPGDLLARLKIAVLRRRLEGERFRVEKRLQPYMELILLAGKAEDTMGLIRIVDELYNKLADPSFEKLHGDLEQVLSVTLKELTEYSWEDFLTEELYEDALESYVEQLAGQITGIEDASVTEAMEEKRRTKHKITAVSYTHLSMGPIGLEPMTLCL